MSLQAGNNENSQAVPSAQAPAVPALINVIVGEGGLLAYLRITPPSGGGEGPTLAKLRDALSKNHITVNIDLELLNSLAENPVYDQEIVIAQGIAPVNGADGTATLLVDMENKGRPKMMDDDRVDYYDLGLIRNVAAGELLCAITPPTAGTPGQSVRGEVLRPKTGKPAPITPGPNTEMNADGTAIVSKISGQYEFDGKRVSVTETYTIHSDVDTSTGNITVKGNLVIRGKVNSGFTIEAGGYVNVVGVVDAATITAGKDINLQSGANGSTITCQGNFRSRFLENCNVFVHGDIHTDYILNSNVRCKKNLKAEGVMSKILGGSIIVSQKVECRTIGSAAGIKTKLEIGIDPELIERQRFLTDQIPEIEKQMKSLEPLLKLLKQLEMTRRLDDEKKIALEKASFTYETHQRMLEEARKELKDITEAMLHRNFGKILCTGITYPGTVITIGSASYTVTGNLMNTSFYYSNGEVTLGSAR